MREIKFRGKRVDNGKWIYGSLISIIYDNGLRKDAEFCVIVEGLDYKRRKEVIPETVGQYTGLKDKNGKEIYEGDTIEWISYDWIDDCLCDKRKLQETVEYLGGCFYPVCSMPSEEFEVIGDIHTTKENK